MSSLTSYELIKKLLEYNNIDIDARIQKELELLIDAPSFIPDAFLKAYQAIVIDKTATAQPFNECHSEIAYRLGITTMAPGKMSFHYPVAPSALPDIDSDFGDNKLVREYAIAKYGKDKVCSISTYGKYKFKSLLNDLTRLFKDEDGERLISLEEVKELGKKLGLQIDNKITVDTVDDEDDDGDDEGVTFDNEHIQLFEKKYPYVFKHFKTLYGLPKYAGKHAGGILILPENFSSLIPVRKSKDEYATEWIEGQGATELGSMGAIKIDLLGLNTLRILDDANKMVVKNFGLNEDSPSPCDCASVGRVCSTNNKLPFFVRNNSNGESIKIIDLDRLCLFIPAIYQSIREGHTEGVFQLEPRGITEFAKAYGPQKFLDLALITSLYRPGAMDCHLDAEGMPIDKETHPFEYKAAQGAHLRFVERIQGREKITYTSPKLESVLKDSVGIATFQEDLSRIIMAMTGCSFAEAEKTRKFFTKVKPELLRTDPATIATVESMKKSFIEKSMANDCTEEEAVDTWNMILPYARYGFNKAHAVSYSIISYETAFFRALYPREFFTSLLTHNTGKDSKVFEYIRAAQRLNITVNKPSINESEVDFTINDKGQIVSSLVLIKGVGEKAAENIIQNRNAVGPFTSLEDFLSRDITWRVVNKRVLEAMIQSGCFDEISPNRALTLAKTLIEKGAKKKSDYEVVDMFDEDDDTQVKKGRKNQEIVVEDWTPEAKIKLEREFFGFTFEDPLSDKLEQVRTYYDAFAKICSEAGQTATFGIIEDIFIKQDKNGNDMAFINVKDLSGNKQRWVLFSSIFGQFKKLLMKNEPYFAFGKFDVKYDSFTIQGIQTISAFTSILNKIKTT